MPVRKPDFSCFHSNFRQCPVEVLKQSILVRKGARASPFRAQLISEVPLEIAQGENRSYEQWDLRFLAGHGIMGLLTVEGFVSV